jgi:hypothetical protein
MSDEGAGAFLARLTVKLADAGVPSMVVGSFASSFHGVPRSSQDLDLVIDPQPESLRRFLAGRRQPASIARRLGDSTAPR